MCEWVLLVQHTGASDVRFVECIEQNDSHGHIRVVPSHEVVKDTLFVFGGKEHERVPRCEEEQVKDEPIEWHLGDFIYFVVGGMESNP